MSDFKVGETVELLHDGKPTGIRGTVDYVSPIAKVPTVEFHFLAGERACRVSPDYLRRVEPEFIVQPGDLLEVASGAMYTTTRDDVKGQPASYVKRVWRKVDDTTLKVVWEREK